MDLARLEIAGDGAMRAHLVDNRGRPRVEELPADARARPFYGRVIDFAARRLGDGDGGASSVDGDYEANLPLLTQLARAALQAVRARDAVERGVPLPSQNTGSPSEIGFWQSLYEREGDGWDVARPAPPLARWFAEHSPAGRRALVVGCGRGHEARLLAARGAIVTAIDFAPMAIAEARALAERDGAAIEFLERDLFTLGGDAALRGAFELVVEHCCFCAIDPARRDEYADVVAALVPPGGALVGLFYCHGRAGGPPFSVGEAELERHFARAFTLTSLSTPADSIATRQGDERLAVFSRR